MSIHTDHAVARLAAMQCGLFSRGQARAAGFSSSSIHRRLHWGTWQTVERHVYSLAGWPDGYRRRLWIASLAIPAAVVSRRSAGQLHRMPGLTTSVPTITVPKGQRHDDIDGVRIHETRRLRPFDRIEVDGLAVTTPTRTIIDVAAELSYARLAHVIDQSVQADIIFREELRAALLSITRRGRKGGRILRLYFEHRMDTPITEVSELEYRFDRIIAEANLAAPVKQFRPPWYEGLRGTVDRAWPDHHLIVELDGRSFHRTMQAMADDRRRDRVAQRHGYRVLRYTADELRCRPAELLDDLEVLLTEPEQRVS